MVETNALAATQAYSKALTHGIDIKGGGTDGVDKAGAGASFAQILAEAGNDAIKSGVASEQVSMEAVTGNAGLADIVTAVSNAEATLETVVAVRDRVIQAYQDIIKMPI
ncbi:flagellar hook-basal body complex protein FliE [Sneathiella sp.]|uniref:flagellar hook-basal body complex protein FliE n=1 Tax=Sneathiella sp. TaxID=1964365 RepID=UPI00356A233C